MKQNGTQSTFKSNFKELYVLHTMVHKGKKR